jgi:hypothetical protein
MIDTSGITADVQKFYAAGDTISWWFETIGNGAGGTTNAIINELVQSLQNNSDAKYDFGKKKLKSETKKDNRIPLIEKKLKDTTEDNESQINLTLNSTPQDANTLEEAFSSVSSVAQNLIIQPAALIAVADSVRPDTVSGGQTFAYIRNFTFSEQIVDAQAGIILPPGYSTATPLLNIPGTKSLTWAITADNSITQAEDAVIQIFAQGIDANSGNPVYSQIVTDLIRVEPKARIQLNAWIESPVTARNGLVSVGQQIIIKTWADEDLSVVSEMAGVTGQGSITIEPDTFNLVQPATATQVFNGLSDTLEWRIEAPRNPINARSIRFNLTDLPQDKNSGEEVFVEGGNGTIAFAIGAQQRHIQLVNLNDSLIVEQSFRRGDENVPILAFEVINPGTENEVTVESITLAFLATATEDTLNEAALTDMLASLAVVDYNDRDIVFGQYNIAEGSATNPLQINFDMISEVITAASSDTLAILANFNATATNRSFKLVLSDLFAWDVNPDIGLDVLDESGNPLQRDGLTSDDLTVIPADPEESFRNYPNPFGRDEDRTTIVFYLEQDSDVEIRIFTLTGGLVWTKIETNMFRGLHDGDVTWDGRNDRGNIVLNGVYLCHIQIKPRGGGSNQTFITKIAYIK